MDRCVEVVAKFGDTLIDVRLLPSGGGYRIGCAPGVDLPATVATDFPLVTGTTVNVPIGATSLYPPGAHPLVADQVVELAFDQITVRIALVPRPPRSLRGPRGDLRLPTYLGGSLVVHLAAWGLIIALVAPAASAALRKPIVHARHVVPYKTQVVDEPRKPTHAGAEAARVLAAAPAIAPSMPSVLEGTSGAVMLGGFAGMVSAVGGTIDLGKAFVDMKSFVRPDDWEAGGFGGAQRKFDPRLEVSKTGRYATVSHGHAAGDDYDLGETPTPALALCSGTACVAVGGLDTVAIRGVLDDRSHAIAACYTRAHARTAVDIVVDFQVAPDGSVSHARGRGAIATCVADLVSSTTFPTAAEATRVRYPVAFRPAA